MTILNILGKAVALIIVVVITFLYINHMITIEKDSMYVRHAKNGAHINILFDRDLNSIKYVHYSGPYTSQMTIIDSKTNREIKLSSREDVLNILGTSQLIDNGVNGTSISLWPYKDYVDFTLRYNGKTYGEYLIINNTKIDKSSTKDSVANIMSQFMK